MIKAIIFDFDGLILDTETPDFEAWVRVFRESGCPFPEKQMLGRIGTNAESFDPAQYIINVLHGSAPEVSEINRRWKAYYEALIAGASLLDGVGSVLAAARSAGLTLAIASSSTKRWVLEHLEKCSLSNCFDEFVFKDDVKEVKPSPELYALALMRLGVKPPEAFAFEDSPNGIASAKAAGLFCVAIPNPVTSRLDLRAAGADLILERLDQRPLAWIIKKAGNANLRSQL